MLKAKERSSDTPILLAEQNMGSNDVRLNILKYICSRIRHRVDPADNAHGLDSNYCHAQ